MDEQSVIYRFGWFELDPGRRSLRSIENGEPVALTAKLFDTLLYLIKHRGQLVGKQALLEAVWPNVIVEEANLKQTISGLRRALQEDPQAREYIATIPGRGYQFVAEVNSVSSITRQARPKAKLSFLIIGLLVAALAFVLIDQYRIRAGTEPVERVAEQVAPPQGEVVSIAVLPFVNMIGDPEQEYFSDGISEELLNVLAKIPGLRVPSRTSSFSFKGQNMDLPTIAAALNVDHVLEGSVRREGDRLRVIAQLIDVENDSHLWTATYERQLISVFAIQDEIAANVAEALQLELFGGTSPRSDARRTNNVEAHDAYLLGKHHMLTRRIEDIRKAQDYFQRAVELDSDYALAYGILGGSFMALYDRGVIGFEAMLAGAERSVNRAIQLGPELGEAYAYRALLLERKGDAAGSERDFLKSIELNPNFAETYFWYSLRLRDLGRFAEAREMIQAAFDLDPLSPIINHSFGRTLAIDGNLDEARAYFRRTNEIEPSYAAVYFSWATVEIQAGRLADGLSLLRTATALDARIPRHAEFVAFTYVSLGDLEQAQVWFDRAASLQADQNRALFLGEFIPLVLQLQDTDRLTSILMGQSLRIRRDVDEQDMWSALFRLAALRNGEVATARQLFSRLWPELLGPGQAQVSLRNFEEAVDIAWLLREEGDSERANQLLNEALAVLEDVPPGVVPFEIVKVRVLALLGREAQALLTFRTAIDEGWRLLTWTLEADPALASLRGDPEFQAMVEEIESDLAVQRERVQEMERNGELAPMPDLVPSE